MFEKIVEGFKRQPFLWAAVICMLVITVLTPLTRRVPQPPPILGEVPQFTLTNENNQPFGSQQLAGKAYVASFVFTRCKTFCPIIFQHLKSLQERIQIAKLPLTIVSFTVDPDHDTPDILKTQANVLSADPQIWTFLTSEKSTMIKLVEGGFMLGMGEATMSGELMDIAHAQKLVLVDANGKIRGFYDATSAGIDETFARAEAIAGESFF
jgi:protein SCO1/2